ENGRLFRLVAHRDCLLPFERAREEEREVLRDRTADAGLDPVEAEARVDAERLVRLIADAALILAAAAPDLGGDDAALRVAELGRRRAGGHRRLFQRVGADCDLGA